MSSKILAAVSFLLLVTACTNLPPVGTTIADRQLVNDISRIVGIYETARGGSKEPQLIATQPVRKDNQKFTEFWTFNSNGNEVVYLTTLSPSPKGGTDYSVAFLGYRFFCAGGADCYASTRRVCGDKKMRWGNPFGELETAPVTMRDEKGRVIMIVRC